MQTATTSDTVRVRHWDHANITVNDLEQTIGFYGRLLDFVVVERGGDEAPFPWAIIRSGEAMLCIYEHPSLPVGPKYPEAPLTHEVRHLALRIQGGLAFLRRLNDQGVALLFGGPVEWPHSTSYYFVDPSGHQIEVVVWNDDSIRFDSLAPL